MAGTVEGNKKVAKTIKQRYGADFYAQIGAKGGRKSDNGGFASKKVDKDGLNGSQRATVAGRKGGHTPRKTSKVEAHHGDGMKYELLP